MDCRDIEQLVDYYLEDEMGLEEKLLFEEHLTECTCCSELVLDYQQVIEVARKLGQSPIPRSVSLKLRRTLKDKVGVF